MHFVTLTVPPPRTDHNLIHNTTWGRSPGQKCLQVRFCENVRFRPFSWVRAHDFQHSSQFFATSQMCTDSLSKTFGEVYINFWTIWYTFRAFFGSFSCHSNRELLAQMEAIMMHFVTLTVHPPRTDHSLMHNTTDHMFLSCEILKTIKYTSYLRVGVLTQASFRLTAMVGESHHV
jgi:hypothetical protein